MWMVVWNNVRPLFYFIARVITMKTTNKVIVIGMVHN